MKWNLRLAAAQRDIWKASQLQAMLADAGLVISAGKMSHLRSSQPVTIRLEGLQIICTVLGCTPKRPAVLEDLPLPTTRPGRGRSTAGRGGRGADPAPAHRPQQTPGMMTASPRCRADASIEARRAAASSAWPRACCVGRFAAAAKPSPPRIRSAAAAPAPAEPSRSTTASAGSAAGRPA